MPVLNLLRFIMAHPLNRDNKLKAIARFVKWQVGSRMLSGEIIYDWVNGSRFLVRAGETGLTGNIYTGLHEFQDMAFLLHVLRPTDLFIDVGSNVGSYTILACAAIGARGYAFEPVPGTYKRLIENIRINHLEDRVKCMNVGVGREQGNIYFTSDMDTSNHVLATGERNVTAIGVDVTSLDAVLGSETPAIMKIDVEGFETPVLEGALATLKKQTLHSVIVEIDVGENRYGFDQSRAMEIMFDHGFKTYSYNPLERTMVNLQGKKPEYGNTLFIRDVSLVLERIKSSSRITVLGKQF